MAMRRTLSPALPLGTGRRSFYKALSMAKPDLGMKRICVACGAKFYDMAKVPASCPKCGTDQPAEQPRPKRAPAVPDEKIKKKRAAVAGADGEADDAETEDTDADADAAGIESDELEDEDETIDAEIEVEGERERDEEG